MKIIKQQLLNEDPTVKELKRLIIEAKAAGAKNADIVNLIIMASDLNPSVLKLLYEYGLFSLLEDCEKKMEGKPEVTFSE